MTLFISAVVVQDLAFPQDQIGTKVGQDDKLRTSRVLLSDSSVSVHRSVRVTNRPCQKSLKRSTKIPYRPLNNLKICHCRMYLNRFAAYFCSQILPLQMRIPYLSFDTDQVGTLMKTARNNGGVVCGGEHHLNISEM